MNKASLFDPPLMPDMIIEGLNRYDERPCLLLGDRVATYREVREETSRMVQALHSLGLKQGARIAVLSANRPEVLSNIAAMQIAGCCGIPLHPLGSLEDHAYVLNTAGVDALIFDPSAFGEHALALRERAPGLKHLLAFGGSEQATDYLALAATFEATALQRPDVTPEDVSSISFTGGTTGKPKGVMCSYRATAYMTQIQMADWEFPEELRMLIATPLSHAAAAFLVPVLQKGGAFYVMSGFSPDAFFDMVETHRITTTMLVPVMLYFLLDHPRSASADLSSLETVFYGASPASPARLTQAIEQWGPVFQQFYGQAEAPMVLATMQRHEHDPEKPERLAACGRPSPWMHMALLDSAGNIVDPGEPGEICVRGPLVMNGYLDQPEATAEAFAGGWLHTGDVGRLDEDGFLHIVDRTKDMIVSGGFNVFPREVEDTLSAHPAVAQVVVIGTPDPQWGEAVTAVIVLRAGAEAGEALTAELQAHVKAARGSLQSPKRIDYVDAIPLTAVGKPDKKVVRARYWEGASRQVG